jgi:nucleoside-diphosphate-sugar epimerase
MSDRSIHAVTGAFGYSGKYIAQKLLALDHTVITLTNSTHRANEFADRVTAFPFHFEQPDELRRSLRNVQVLYNTYWVRFNHRLFKHDDAVNNTLVLIEAAKQAGVERFIHISITNPNENSPLEYFRGKARLERALSESGLSYTILRPAVLFGKEDILINNMAWTLRHLPVFGVFGDGQYKIQPIYVEDLADLAVHYGVIGDNVTINAIGPETFTYHELVEVISHLIKVRRPILSVHPWLGYLASRIIGAFVGDILITRDEISGLMANLLYVDSPPTGTTKLTEWVRQHANTLGRAYTSELSRRKDRESAYRSN